MNILFIGIGSIAERHIRNIRSLFSDVNIDVIRSGRGKKLSTTIEQLIKNVYTDIKEIQAYYDAVFITNPTDIHYETLLKYHEYSDAFFIEKPVFISGLEDITPFISKNNIYYVASPLRYSKVVQYVKNEIDFSKVYSIRSISSSYLPEWRNGIDYRNTYSAHKNMGGGVSIDLIHEWDYMQYLVGFPHTVHSLICRKSDLEIDSDDIAVYIAEYENMVVEIHLDYFGRYPLRKMEIFTQKDTISVDLIDQSIQFLHSNKAIKFPDNRDLYQMDELKHFFDIIAGNVQNDNGLEEACRVLRIERGMQILQC